MYTIYCCLNKANGKKYIGFDSHWPNRKSAHICEAFTRSNKKYPLYRALRKYTAENFEWSTLYQTNDRDFALNIMEKYFILNLNTHYRTGHGYNMTYGGEGTFGYKFTDEQKAKISKAHRGRVFSDELKALWSKQRTGIKQSDSHRAASGNGRAKTHSFLKDGKKITIHNLSKYCRDNNLPHGSGNLCNVEKGKLLQYKGYSKVE